MDSAKFMCDITPCGRRRIDCGIPVQILLMPYHKSLFEMYFNCYK
jgi:hypothetical protein